MRLRKIKIQNFRKLNDVEINLGDATFLIGANNAENQVHWMSSNIWLQTRNLIIVAVLNI